jgi:hypothetical protein
MVDGAPQITELAVDLHEHLIQVPAPLRIAAHVRDASLTNLGGEHRAKPFHQNRTVSWLMSIPRSAKRSSTFRSDSGYHNETDDLWRAIEISERIAHPPRLTQRGQPEDLL